MKKILTHLFEGQTLSKAESKQILIDLASGNYNVSQMASFMTAYCMRSITVDELEGFRDAMLELCLNADLPSDELIDLVGTGGDGKDTFNISTLSSFVVAGAGYKVSKHGNYGVSSACGSSNVMEHLGYRFTNNMDSLKRSLDEANICFLHAPLFHPAMKTVAPIRKELGVKTFFNMLGPMVNPASPKYQFLGVFSLELARLYAYLYQKTEKQYMIIHTLTGYDEISLTAPFKVFSNEGEALYNPSLFGATLNPEDLFGGGTIGESADIFVNVLNNKGTEAQLRAVLANSAMAIKCKERNKSIDECYSIAQESLASGKALNSFKALLDSQKVTA
ncbi:anthranilate phosphoribosyltransferase [Solitalea sp. MAHUQ-68]|uniref:Anthranilate phosphoribosyltransferase n=1 Tax=Solitalea agri TaxID=2953739 RepID=A0A9X2EZX4_9SPHI|nr:anthranilate phosphoribosyltransferase [Solitalea agri]MCO4291666.1 anthranilate phosphoribosyltransferase [Solitalea agri]